MQLSVNIHVDHRVEPHMFENNALIDCQSIHIMCPNSLMLWNDLAIDVDMRNMWISTITANNTCPS